jgi:hypothetical protein
MVRHEHRSLRVSSYEVQQGLEHAAHLPLRLLENTTYVVAEVGVEQGFELDAARLPEERSFAVVKKLGHESRVRAGEDIARRLNMVLDPAADHTVYALAGAESLLELIEGDENPLPLSLVHAAREVEQPVQAAHEIVV